MAVAPSKSERARQSGAAQIDIGGGVRITTESREEFFEVEALLDTCFAPGREMLSSYRLRDGAPPEAALCLVARDEDGALAGCIRFWRIRIGEAGSPALLLGPVAVHPIRQGEGVGAALMREGLARAVEQGWSRVVLVGDAPYYRRFGFEPAADYLDFPPPTNPKRVLARALQPGAFEGVHGAVRPWARG